MPTLLAPVLESMKTKHNQCSDCRDGEINYAEDDVFLVVVKEEGKRGFVKRAYLCKDHRDMYEEDGYEVSLA